MKLRWSRRADADLERLWHFVAAFSTERADMVEANLHRRIDRLRNFPKLGRIVRAPDVRALSLPDIQYVVTYSIVSDEVRILTIHHTRERGDHA